MSILSDGTIDRIGPKIIKPFRRSQVNSGSYDLRLGKTIMLLPYGDPKASKFGPPVDVGDPAFLEKEIASWYEVPLPHTLAGGACALGVTEESICLPPYLQAYVHGKSSIGRLFLQPHMAGLVDPGWEGPLTLELFNARNRGIRLYPGMRIAQIAFHELDYKATNPYVGHYSYDLSPVPSRYELDEPGPITERTYS